MAPKRSAESKLAAGPSTKRPKVDNQVPSSPVSDKLEDYDWRKINAYLNGDGKVRREIDAAEHLEQCLNSNKVETFDFPVPRWRQEQEDQKYLMETDPFCHEGTNEDHALPHDAATRALTDDTPDLDVVDAEFAAHPIEHSFEETSQVLQPRFVPMQPWEKHSVQAMPTIPRDVLHPSHLGVSRERSATPSSSSRSKTVHMHQQQPQSIALASIHSSCTLGTSAGQTSQNNNQSLSQNVDEHPYQSPNPLVGTAASQRTDETASPHTDQQINVATTQSADQTLACGYCNKTFKLDSSKRRHERDLHERQPHERRSFACPICPKTYTRNDALLAHGRQVHSVELPHQSHRLHNTQGQ